LVVKEDVNNEDSPDSGTYCNCETLTFDNANTVAYELNATDSVEMSFPVGTVANPALIVQILAIVAYELRLFEIVQMFATVAYELSAEEIVEISLPVAYPPVIELVTVDNAAFVVERLVERFCIKTVLFAVESATSFTYDDSDDSC
jgi:hypothetical protein